jgi:osmotically-inducible protein OsmY
MIMERSVGQQALQERIEMALSANPYLPGKRVYFRADEGQVTLSGRVNSYFQKQMAQESIRRVDGVRQIQNLLEVCWS